MTLSKTNWPQIFSNQGTVQNFKLNKVSKYKPSDFKAYVTQKDFFKSDLPKLKITNDVKKFFTFDNPYYVACCSAYFCTYLCGISSNHLRGISSNHFDYNSNTLISAICKYHLYYHMARCLRTPEKLKTYMKDKDFALLRKHIPVKYKWLLLIRKTKKKRYCC